MSRLLDPFMQSLRKKLMNQTRFSIQFYKTLTMEFFCQIKTEFLPIKQAEKSLNSCRFTTKCPHRVELRQILGKIYLKKN